VEAVARAGAWGRGLAAIGVAALAACHGAAGEPAVTMTLTSSAFERGSTIPRAHTCDGDDRSPPLAWTGAPSGARSFALVMDDPDARHGTWVHWVLWNLPGDARAMAAAVQPDAELPSGARHGHNDFGPSGWGGPCPPPGPAHHYSFRVYAVDQTLTLAAGASKGALERALHGHVLAQSELVGTYARAAQP